MRLSLLVWVDETRASIAVINSAFGIDPTERSEAQYITVES